MKQRLCIGVTERGVLTCAHCPEYAGDFLRGLCAQPGANLKQRPDALPARLSV